MKIEYLKEKKELIPVVLLVISVFMAVLIFIKVVGFYVAPAKAESLVKKAVAHSNTNAKGTETYLAESKTVADKLKRENLFAPPPPKEHPVKAVPAILGDEVLINGKWYKAGDMVEDAKIVAIGPTDVKIEWDGKVSVFCPIDAGSPSAPGGPSRVTAGARGAGERAEMVVIRSGTGPMPSRGGMEGFGGGMRDRWQSMSEAERDRFRAEMRDRRERWERMSEAERERFRAEMSERFGGGPPPGGGRGPGGRGSEGGRGPGGGRGSEGGRR